MRWRGIAVLALGALLAGCATPEAFREQKARALPSAALPDTYNPNPASYGHPLRVIGFALHPVGVIADYVFVRPLYLLTGTFPAAYGYREEDARAYWEHHPELVEPKSQPKTPY